MPKEPSAIHTVSRTLRVRRSAIAATRRNPLPIASRAVANSSTPAHRGHVISSVPRARTSVPPLPPARVPDLAEDPLLIPELERLREAPTDRMMHAFVAEDVEHDPPPVAVGRAKSAIVCVAEFPQMDDGGAAVLAGGAIGKTECHSRAEEARTFGSCDPLQFRFRYIGLPEMEHPRDSAVLERIDCISSGIVAHIRRGVNCAREYPLSSFSSPEHRKMQTAQLGVELVTNKLLTTLRLNRPKEIGPHTGGLRPLSPGDSDDGTAPDEGQGLPRRGARGR